MLEKFSNQACALSTIISHTDLFYSVVLFNNRDKELITLPDLFGLRKMVNCPRYLTSLFILYIVFLNFN